MLCAPSLSTNTTATEVVILCQHMQGAAAMTGQVSGLTAQIREGAPECESTHCTTHREMLASRKMPLELNSVLNDIECR